MKTFVNIYLDDLRPCPQHPSWLLAKTADEALDLMEQYRGQVRFLSLDHDLQDTHIPERHGKWFVNNMIDRGLYAEVIYLHTGNGVGRANMLSYLLQALGMGALPSHVTVHNSPMPNYNIATGEFFKD
jgi:hypothetical protein